MIDALARDAFIDALDDSRLQLRVWESVPPSFDAALTHAMRLEVLIRIEKKSEETSRPRHMRAVEIDHEEPVAVETPVVQKAASLEHRSTIGQPVERTTNKGNVKKNAQLAKRLSPTSECSASELSAVEKKLRQDMSRMMHEVTESVKGLQLKVEPCITGRTPPTFVTGQHHQLLLATNAHRRLSSRGNRITGHREEVETTNNSINVLHSIAESISRTREAHPVIVINVERLESIGRTVRC